MTLLHSASVPQLSIGFSPCPNDTFIFNALVNGAVTSPDFQLQKESLADVETLNQWAVAGKLDITKLSFHALGHVLDEYVLLRSGSALGRGCGPLLLQRGGRDTVLRPEAIIAVPGQYTTAALLFRMAYPACRNLVNMSFEKIMPAIVNHEVDAGVVIHESRFTYEQYGLGAILDLGAWWEDATGCPIPLGGIVAKRRLGKDILSAVEKAIAASLSWAYKNEEECKPYIKAHAQELDEQVIASHIGLYVNEYSRDLGEDGLAAVREFLQRGNEAGAFKCRTDNITLSDMAQN